MSSHLLLSAAVQPGGFMFQGNMAQNGANVGLQYNIAAGKVWIAPSAEVSYRSFGVSEGLNGALFLASGGLGLGIPIKEYSALDIRLGGGWHRGAWSDPAAGVYAQDEPLAYASLDFRWGFPSWALLFSAEVLGLFAENIIFQPSGEAGVAIKLTKSMEVTALVQGGMWFHPREPGPFENFQLAGSIGVRCKFFKKAGTSRQGQNQPEGSLGGQLEKTGVGESLSVDRILFQPNEARIDEESYPLLDEIVAFLKRRPGVVLEIQGFVNPVGHPEAEKSFSLERAGAVRQYLIEKGISPERLIAVGMGSAESDENAESNRRVVFVIREL